MHGRSGGLVLVLTAMAGTLAAQGLDAGRPGPRTLLPRAQEIALARSAAPASVSADATVLVLTQGGFEVAESGTSGVTCVVNRSQPESLEPHCFDPEGAATVLPIQLRRTELLMAGKTIPEINREIADGLLSGRYRLPRRPAMSYMMSSAQVLYNDDGKLVGQWQPHLMIYYPHLTAAELGLGGQPSTQAALVVDGGQPLANFIVVVREFVDPVATGTAAR